MVAKHEHFGVPDRPSCWHRIRHCAYVDCNIHGSPDKGVIAHLPIVNDEILGGHGLVADHQEIDPVSTLFRSGPFPQRSHFHDLLKFVGVFDDLLVEVCEHTAERNAVDCDLLRGKRLRQPAGIGGNTALLWVLTDAMVTTDIRWGFSRAYLFMMLMVPFRLTPISSSESCTPAQ